jgi:hypothetical protein
MVKAGEQPVQLEPSGTVTATPAAVPVTQTEALPNWRTWWQLFFGAN